MRALIGGLLAGSLVGSFVGSFVGSLAGCMERTFDPPLEPPPFGTGPGPRFCRYDTGCHPGEVCARNDACLPGNLVRFAHVSWTVSGMAAGAASCTAARDLRIQLNNADVIGGLAYAPVPCEAGKFSIDKLPLDYTFVWLGRESGLNPIAATIDPVTGEAALDLPYPAAAAPGIP
jgi:hypothetical protein